MKFNSNLQTSRPLLTIIILTSLLTVNVVVCDTIYVANNNSSSFHATNQNDTLWSDVKEIDRAQTLLNQSSHISDTAVSSSSSSPSPYIGAESNLSVATTATTSKSTITTNSKTNDSAAAAQRQQPISSTTSSVFFSITTTTSFEGISSSSLDNLQNDPTFNLTTVDTNSSVLSFYLKNKTQIVSTSNNNTNKNRNSLQWHIYVFGMFFALLTGLTFYTLIHHIICLTICQRGYLMMSNLLLCIVCLLRTIYMFNLEASGGGGHHSTPYHLLLHESPTFLLQSTMMCFVGGLSIYTETQWLKSKTFNNNSLIVNILVLPYIVLTLGCVLVLTAVDYNNFDRTKRLCLDRILKAVSFLWSSTIATLTCILYKRIYKASMRRQSQIIRVTLTKLHIEGTQLPKKLPKPCLCLSAKAAFFTCIFSLIICVILIIGIVFSYDYNTILLTTGQATSGPRWLYQNMFRFCEVLMCLSLSCGLFWSQCGHPCRRLIGTSSTSTLWSSLRKHSTIWHAPAEGLRRFSDRRRHSSDEGYNCHGMFGIYGTASSHAVARTNFTFERWERARRPVPMIPITVSDVPLAAAATDNNFSTMPPQPILKTFQQHGGGSCRISPQHILQSSQLALQRTRRTVSAGIRSLARSSRSSSSSISSGSSVRPSPSKGLTLPSIKQKEIIQWNDQEIDRRLAVRSGYNEENEHHYAAVKSKFNKRFFGGGSRRRIECENTRIHKSHDVAVNTKTDQHHLTYLKSVRQRKPRHLESGGKRSKVKELANKVLMVSRATQVYIPSPHKYSTDNCDHDDNSVVYHSQRVQRLNNTDHQLTKAVRRTFPHTEMPHTSSNSRRCWLQFGGGGSSTSCSSESAGNSFDVRFYMYSPQRRNYGDGSLVDGGGSSPSHDFHEQYYSNKLNGGRPHSFLDVSCDSTDNGRISDGFIPPPIPDPIPPPLPPRNVFEMPRTKVSCGVDADDSLSNSSQDPSLDFPTVATTKQHKLRYFLPRFRKTVKVDKSTCDIVVVGDIPAKVSTQQKEIIDHSDGATSTFNLSLPLEKGTYTTVCQTSKNHQDITPDSAVYLELNLPDNDADDNEQVAKQSLVWLDHESKSVLKLGKSISLTSLSKETDDNEKIASIHRRLSLIEFQEEEEEESASLIQAPVLYSVSTATTTIATATNDEAFQCCATVDQKTFVQGDSFAPWKTQLHQEVGTGFMSSSDSVYDSGDESSVVSLENCPRYKQIDFQELTNF